MRDYKEKPDLFLDDLLRYKGRDDAGLTCRNKQLVCSSYSWPRKKWLRCVPASIGGQLWLHIREVLRLVTLHNADNLARQSRTVTSILQHGTKNVEDQYLYIFLELYYSILKMKRSEFSMMGIYIHVHWTFWFSWILPLKLLAVSARKVE